MKFKLAIAFFLLVFIFSSCVSYKKIPYFKDVPDSTSLSVQLPNFNEPVIQYDDILSIAVNTLDLQSSTGINMSTPTISGAGASSAVSGLQALSGGGSSLAIPSNSTYRVNRRGDIDVPLIGKISVLGLTTTELKDTIQKKMTEYYKMPTVDVRFANFKVTVLGEVMRPGTYTIPNEKLTLLEAIGLSGDMTIFGKRDNVLLMRDSLDKKKMVRLNLNSKQFISSPYYYIRQNDIIYVEPTEAKIANLDAVQTKYIGIASAVLSIIIILATRLK